MLPYAVFCCLLFVHVKGECKTCELRNLVIELGKITCLGETNANLNFLPTKWTGSKWSCLDKGFGEIQNLSRNQTEHSRTNDCTTIIRSINRRIRDIKRQCISRHCPNIRVEAERCVHATTGNMAAFLDEAKNYLIQLTYSK